MKTFGRMMLGAILNAAGIVIGGVIGLWRPGALTARQERLVQVLLGVFTVFYGLRLTVINLEPPFTHILKQFGVIILSLMLGRLVGSLLRLQKISNKVGQRAREAFAGHADKQGPPSVGFKMCAALYCAAPLGIIGAVGDGLSGYYYPLLIKGIMDGLATMGLARTFQWGPMLAAVPVLALEGSITVFSRQAAGNCAGAAHLLPMTSAVCGVLIFTVALVILQIKRIALADYLPSILFAPVMAWLFR
jgi:uncharacterized membrane protein YqgA involved in biofilm formation